MTGIGALRSVWHRARPEPRLTKQLLLAWLLGVAAAGSSVALLLTSGWLISRAAQHPPVLYLMVAIVGVRTFGISRSLLRYSERLVSHDAAFRLLTDVRIAVYERITPLAGASLGRWRRGDVVSRLVDDVDSVGDLLLRGVLPTATTIGVCLASLTCVALVLPTVAVVQATIVTALVLALPALLRGLTQRADRSIAPLRGALASEAAEIVAAAPELVVHGAARAAVQRLADAAEALRRAEQRSSWGAGLAGALTLVTVGAAVAISVVLGAAAVADGTLAPQWLAVVVLAPLALHEPLTAVPIATLHTMRAAEAVARIQELLNQVPDVATTQAHLPAPSRAPIQVRGVSARWPGGPDVLHDVDLDIAPGARIAVVGDSGSGKSTLAAVLLRLLPSRTGVITWGGTSLTDIDEAQLRARIGLLDQEAHVFDTTVRENLRIARPDANDDEMWLALEQAGLASFVLALPARLDTLVGESGRAMSGGERQRLALTRLLLAGHEVLVLDEPTEHLDDETARQLTHDLLGLAPARTIVLITHAQHGLDDVDERITIRNGRATRAVGVHG